MAAGDGLVSMTPTSIAHSGTSASINADGGVDFTAVTSLSLNGVFTSAYDNYLIVFLTEGSAGLNIALRLRASGTDATAGNYTRQYLFVDGGSRSAARLTSETSAVVAHADTSGPRGSHAHIYGPALAQPTAFRSLSMYAALQIADEANTHSLSTAYDGCTLLALPSGNITGNVHVFGYEE